MHSRKRKTSLWKTLLTCGLAIAAGFAAIPFFAGVNDAEGIDWVFKAAFVAGGFAAGVLAGLLLVLKDRLTGKEGELINDNDDTPW